MNVCVYVYVCKYVCMFVGMYIMEKDNNFTLEKKLSKNKRASGYWISVLEK